MSIFFIGLLGVISSATASTAPALSTNATSSAINVSVIASRTSGVAPLSVFFDATGTTDSATKRPFHDLQYTWSFGDTANGATWAYGSNPGKNSRNEASGPVAAHVFETPGTYTITTNVTDDGIHFYTNTKPITITVTDSNKVFSGTNTICIAAKTEPVAGADGCPAGAEVHQLTSFSKAINTYALTGKRVLFKRGDQFDNSSTAHIIHTGPGIIGAYGSISSPSPIVTSTVNAGILGLSSKSTPGIADWRIMDFELNGTNAGSNNTGISAAGTINQVLILRMNIHNTHGGVAFLADTLDYWNAHSSPVHTMFDQLSIVDTSITAQTGGAGMTGVFIEANRFTMLGTLIDDTTQIEHVARFPYLNKAIISNNTLSRPAANKHVIKLHAPVWCQTASGQAFYQPVCNYATDTKPTTGVENTGNGTSYTQYVVISDNKLVPASGVAITVNIAPFSSFADNRLKDIIFERNWMTGSAAATQYGVGISGVNEMTARNHILDMSGANTWRTFFQANGGKACPPSDNIRIYNNTAYASDTSSGSIPVIFLNTASSTTNLTVINNLMYFPLSPKGGAIIWATMGTGYIATNNTTNALISPLFTNSTPVVPSDFKPTTGSYAIGTGTSVPVWSDFFQMPEPAKRDMGAVIH